MTQAAEPQESLSPPDHVVNVGDNIDARVRQRQWKTIRVGINAITSFV